MVFAEGMSSWRPLNDMPRLYEAYIAKQDPISAPRESSNLVTPKKELPEVSDVVNKKLEIPGITFLFLGIALSIGVSYMIVKFQANKDYAFINEKIDEVASYKDEICDGVKNGVRVIRSEFKIKAFTPTDNEGKPVKEYYELVTGGFHVLTMTKRNSGFDVVETTSQDMGFKVAEESWVPGTKYGYGLSTPGFKVPTYRGTVQQAYNSAFEFLTSEKKDNSYVPGTYHKISTVSELSTDFYSIDNTYPLKHSSESINSRSWTATKGSVFNTDWIVWYNTEGRHYEIIMNKKYFDKLWLTYSFALTAIISLLYFIIRYKRVISLKIT